VESIPLDARLRVLGLNDLEVVETVVRVKANAERAPERLAPEFSSVIAAHTSPGLEQWWRPSHRTAKEGGHVTEPWLHRRMLGTNARDFVVP